MKKNKNNCHECALLLQLKKIKSHDCSGNSKSTCFDECLIGIIWICVQQMIDVFGRNDVQFDGAFGLTHLSIAVVQQICTIGEWPVFQRNSGHRTINQYSNFLNESSPNYNFILLPTGPDFDSWILSCWKCTFMRLLDSDIAALQSVLFCLFHHSTPLCECSLFFLHYHQIPLWKKNHHLIVHVMQKCWPAFH